MPLNENIIDEYQPNMSKVFTDLNSSRMIKTIDTSASPSHRKIKRNFHPYLRTPTSNNRNSGLLLSVKESFAKTTENVDLNAWRKYREILEQHTPRSSTTITSITTGDRKEMNKSLRRLSELVKGISENDGKISFTSTPKSNALNLSTSAPLSRDTSLVQHLTRRLSERSLSEDKTIDFFDRLQKHKNDSIMRKWREERFKDDNEQRSLEISALEKEQQERGIARNKIEIYSEVYRRLQLELEGLIIEFPKPKKEEFPKLPSEAISLIERVFDRRQPLDEVFAEGFDLKIARKDLLTLRGLEWLNDEIIYFYLNLVCARAEQDTNLPKSYTYNTFFYTNLTTKGYASVKRWTRKVDIFAYDLLFVPVHLTVHWCMLIIDFKKKKIDFYDSMLGEHTACLQALKTYLESESLDKKKVNFDFSGWRMECLKNIPRQLNGSDCGMFACKFAEFASRQAEICFNQEHMPYYRQRMVFEICTKQLL
uniref:Ubiquitin-like protease family profile domain-containing protein n=1 Tax=Acrobeloides nanus TaxID=290746 RepID=A0A914BXW3_9BILA